MPKDKYHRRFRRGVIASGIGITLLGTGAFGKLAQESLEAETNALIRARNQVERAIDAPPTYSQEAFYEAERSGRNLQAEIAQDVATLYDSLGALEQQILAKQPEWMPRITEQPLTNPLNLVILGGALLTLCGAGYMAGAVGAANRYSPLPSETTSDS